MSVVGNKQFFKFQQKHSTLFKDYYSLTSSIYITKSWKECATRIQKTIRRFLVFIKFDPRKAFYSIWGRVVRKLRVLRSTPPVAQLSWSEIKSQYDIMVSDNFVDSISILTESVARLVLSEEDQYFYSTAEFVEPSTLSLESTQAHDIVNSVSFNSVAKIWSIEISSHVVKWLSNADSLFKQIFMARTAQLAAGERSYALSKRLQGCEYPMFETKLGRGMRILWTQIRRETKGTVLIWFVSTHDNVSRCIEAIDISSRRLAKQPVISDSGADTEVLEMQSDGVLADPFGNVPLKLHVVEDEIQASGWKPPLRLSDKQRQVNEESGTVLLLGRSGTGKTLCVCDSMVQDREKHGEEHRHLFVCRSARLCEFVRSYQQDKMDSAAMSMAQFSTLSQFVHDMDELITANNGTSASSFLLHNKVNFRRFVELVYSKPSHGALIKKSKIAPSVAWLHIRSFIKGSIEAVMQNSPLSVDQYTDLTVFGEERCRLCMTDRKEVYALYLRYEDTLKIQGLWDDADYTLDLLTRSKLEPLSTQYDKVYVDEVQDNTQAEIMLYFLAAGMNTQSLFLAGDPAQSVVEGVDFRFEDVRSIVHKLSGGKENIARPMKLLVNYRSHAGVLNCASAVLGKMFDMFPGSAKVLPKDTGLFKGPRPVCGQVDGIEGLANLLRRNERLVVLCVDEEVDHVESELVRLGVKNAVIGIRAAKGLEFQDVVLLNFFKHIPACDYTSWKHLFTTTHPPASNISPQIELQLKLLYTAITRSCNRLLFVETEKSQLSSVMFRWMVGAGLAEMYNAADESTVLMTCDEWRVQGIEFALSAEGEDTVMFLEKAVKCFILGNDTKLLARVETQLQLAALSEKFAAVEKLTEENELTAAKVVMSGLNAGLREEVFVFCTLIESKVEHSNVFHDEVCLNVW